MHRRINKKFILLFGILIVTVLAIVLYPLLRGNTKEQFMSVAQSEVSNPKPQEVRGKPYNELLVVYRYFNQIRAGVYNDTGEGYISEKDFAEIDANAVKKQFGAMTVMKNGPRFWVMDEITGYYNGTPRTIDGYKMNQPGILNLSLADLKNRSAYSIHQVNRKTTYTFKKGQMVYELVSDKNEVYTMQSASREIDKDLTISDLSTLGSRLKLPKGWTYRARVLDQDVTYHINGTAYVIQDDLNNSYQKNP